MYTIQIVGAGYTGARIAQFFSEQKQKVFALTRSAAKAESFLQQGIQPVIADLTKPETLHSIPPAHFIVICPAPDESTEEAYENIYLNGVANYLKAIQKNPKPSLIIYLSSTGVWQDQTGDIFDENVRPIPTSAKARILVQAEKQILSSGFPAVILRLAGIYGPNRNRLKAFQDRKWPLPNTIDRWINLIHVDDIVNSLPMIFKNAKEGETYLGADDEPFLASTLTDWIAERTNLLEKYSFQAGKPGGRRLKNTKWKQLGIQLKYPTFREGYAEFLKGE